MNHPRPTTLRVGAAITAVALAAIGLAGPAAASTGGFPLSFISVTRGDKPVKVKRFQFSGAPVKCAEGTTTYSTQRPLSRMKVRHREFGGTFTRRGTRIRVTGKYKRNLSKVTGTLKVTGKVDGYTRCSSGRLRWKTA
ncbi:MAG TPA: hypothetical protein VFH44_11315 [Solirubrobacterales bacterium]|nr:hypothetical protein [Solirubrobacterales bacterium]